MDARVKPAHDGECGRVQWRRKSLRQREEALKAPPFRYVQARTLVEALEALARQSGLAALIATHNHELAGLMDRRVTIEDGKVVEMN